VNALLATLTGATPLGLGRRVHQLRLDLGMLERRLIRGLGPSPFIERRRPREASETTTRVSVAPREVRIVRVVSETADAVSIHFEAPDGEELAFQAGQFMTVELEVDGVRVRRAYSLAGASVPGESRHVTVKRVPGGLVSNALCDAAAAGGHLAVLGPSGSFTVEEAGGDPEHLVLLAGGSGITPVMSLAATTLETHPSRRVTLIFGNRSEGDVIFRERIAGLAARHPDRFVVDHVLEAPAEGGAGAARPTRADAAPCVKGRLDAETTSARLDALGVVDSERVLYFVCGPTPMMEAVREALLARGVDEARVREESFGRPEARREAHGAESPQPLVVVHRGREVEVIAKPGETLLEAGSRAGVAMPFSCAMGGCGACKVRLAEGTVEMDEPNCLRSSEAASGHVLACIAQATSPCRIEVP
jgi:ferredoxin-NADP reductase